MDEIQSQILVMWKVENTQGVVDGTEEFYVIDSAMNLTLSLGMKHC